MNSIITLTLTLTLIAGETGPPDRAERTGGLRREIRSNPNFNPDPTWRWPQERDSWAQDGTGVGLALKSSMVALVQREVRMILSPLLLVPL